MVRGGAGPRPMALVVTAVVVLLAAPKLLRFWLGDPIFSLGFLVAPWAFWWILRLERQGQAAEAHRALVLVATLVLAVVGWHFRSTWLSLWSVVASLALVALEKDRLRTAFLPLGLLAIMVPPPVFDTLLNGAQLGVAWSAGVMLAVLGIPITWEAFTLSTPDYDFIVTPLCSGMSGLLATTALVGISGAHLAPGRDRVLLALGAGLVITALLNLLRVVILVFVTHHTGPSLIEGAFHDGISLAMSIVATLLLLPLLMGGDRGAASVSEVTA